MRICVLSSGSSGNSIFFEFKKTRFLIDIGLSTKIIEKHLSAINISADSINSILLSHNHQDHTKGAKVFTKKYKIPIYMSTGIYKTEREKLYPETKIFTFKIGKVFFINGIKINPFYLFHDALETAGFVITTENKKIGVATDLGDYSHLLIEKFQHCYTILLETNYDDYMLLQSSYSWDLKMRIRSRRGHLSNRRAAKLIATILAHPNNLKYIFLVHISQENNTLKKARDTIGQVIKNYNKDIKIIDTFQDKPSEVLTI
jgi:phosphoribosyl 1,2-cyclic phosphodiesterase